MSPRCLMSTTFRRCSRCVVFGAALHLSHVAFGQGGITDNTVNTTLRIVQITGTNDTSTGYTRGTVGGIASGVAVPGSTLQFEIQYQMSDSGSVIDPDTGTTVTPAGLCAGVLDITGSTGIYAQAALTKTQASYGGVVTTTDKSGPATGVLAGVAGLEKPFRNLFASAGNNNDPSNGTISSTGITSIVPLVLSQSLITPLSGNGSGENAGWYMLYMFSVAVPASSVGGVFSITADFEDDAAKFSFFDDGIATPDTSNNTTAGRAFFFVMPSPSAVSLLSLAFCPRRQRREVCRGAGS